MMVALVALGGLTLTACGDDGGGGGDVQAYCDLTNEVNAGAEEPTDEQLDALLDAAPGEIKDAGQTLVDFLRSDGDPSDLSQEVLDAIDEIEDFEAENCESTEG